MTEIEITCPNCNEKTTREIEFPKQAIMLQQVIQCDRCHMDIFYDLECEIVVTTF